MTPWSVSPRAGWSSSAARAAIASILQAPSSSEYSLWAWRCTAEALLMGPSIMPIRADGTGAFRDASARFATASELAEQDGAEDAGDDAHSHAAEADDDGPLQRVKTLMNRVDAAIDDGELSLDLGAKFTEVLLNPVEALVDVLSEV